MECFAIYKQFIARGSNFYDMPCINAQNTAYLISY